MEKIETHIVVKMDKAVRLSDYGGKAFSLLPTRKGVKKAITKGLVFVNGERGKTGDWLSGGETLELFKPNIKKGGRKLRIKIPVIFEDDHFAIVSKPAGIPVSGNQFRTLESALSFNLTVSTQPDVLRHPKPVHRLDHPTSGLLIIAKTHKTLTAFSKLFEERKVQKEYMAICIGSLKPAFEISSTIKTKDSFTHVESLRSVPSEKYGTLSLVKLSPTTGRRHQLRIHMFENGTPILGDKQYSLKNKVLYGKGLYLFASKLSFDHPIEQTKLTFDLPMPSKFEKIFSSNSEEE